MEVVWRAGNHWNDFIVPPARDKVLLHRQHAHAVQPCPRGSEGRRSTHRHAEADHRRGASFSYVDMMIPHPSSATYSSFILPRIFPPSSSLLFFPFCAGAGRAVHHHQGRRKPIFFRRSFIQVRQHQGARVRRATLRGRRSRGVHVRRGARPDRRRTSSDVRRSVLRTGERGESLG